MKRLEWMMLLGVIALVAGAGEASAQVQTQAPPVVAGATKVRMETIKVHSAEISGNVGHYGQRKCG